MLEIDDGDWVWVGDKESHIFKFAIANKKISHYSEICIGTLNIILKQGT